MTKDLVIVLAVAAVIPLLLGLMPRLAIPGALVEIVAGVVMGPTVLGWVHPDDVVRALAVLGLSFLLFLGGFEVDARCFRGRTGHHVPPVGEVQLERAFRYVVSERDGERVELPHQIL
jgi:Kef-type K+ transport system membrane component KefB